MAQQNFQFISSIEGIREYRFENGLQVLLIPDSSQSNVIVNIVYHVGSRHEGYGEKGMAHLLEHMLFKSTKNLGDIKKLLSEKGGQANGTTWYDRTNYFEIFPATDENLKWSLEMEAERMIHANIFQADLDKEFSVVRNEFEIGENNPNNILNERILSTAFLWHNYGNSTIGSREDIERVKADRLRVFYQKYYQPDNATLIIGGKFDPEKALQYVDQYFTVIPRPARILEKTYTVEPAQDGERFVELKKAGDIQLAAAAYHTAAYADPDFAAIDALNEILTSDPSGYLYKALIDTNKATGLYGWQPSLRDPGYLYISVSVAKDKNLEEVKEIFLNELDQVGDIDFTEKDLDRAKAKLLRDFENIKNNTISLAVSLTEIIGAGDYRLGFLYRDTIEALTIEDIRRIARKYFIPTNRTLGVFMPQVESVKVQPKEYLEEDIAALTRGYIGKEEIEEAFEFENTIPGIKAKLAINKLQNGMRYAVLHKPVKGKKVLATYRFPIGDTSFFHGKNEVKSLLVSLLKAGTTNRNKEDIQDELDSLKSQMAFGFQGQTLHINISSYEDQMGGVMTLLREILTDATFPEEEFKKALEEKKADIEASMNDPRSVVFSRIGKKVNGYPKGHIYYTPSPEERLEDLKEVHPSQIRDLYRSLGADNGYGTVLSGLEKEYVDQIVHSVFEDWKSKTAYEKILPSYFPTSYSSEKINTPEKENGAVIARINLKIRQDDPDYAALLMADAILGSGGFLTARIPTRLRENEGISYGTGSILNVAQDHSASNWNVYAFYNPSYQEKVDEAIKDEIQKALDTGFTPEEVEVNKKSWSIERATTLGNDHFLVGTLINNLLHKSIPLETYDDLESKVMVLTLEEVNAALRKYIKPEKLTFLYAGDFNKNSKK